MAAAYHSNTTGAAYRLNVEFLGPAEAEAACNQFGGHLVSYASLLEQYEVEQYFLLQGLLLPSYHGSYWLGLSAAAGGWPNFRWTDNVTPPPGLGSYSGWGSMSTGNKSEPPIKEPNNLSFNQTRANELCAAASASQAYNSAWGWADTSCGSTMPSICKTPAARLHVYVSTASEVVPAANATAGSINASSASSGRAAGVRTSNSAIVAAAADSTTLLPSNATYLLNTAALDQQSAQKVCNDNGGHLVHWDSEAEQLEVEAYYVSMGFLLPG